MSIVSTVYLFVYLVHILCVIYMVIQTAPPSRFICYFCSISKSRDILCGGSLIRKFLLNDAVSHLLKTPWVIAALHFFNARLVLCLTAHKRGPFPTECSYVFRVIPAIFLCSCSLIGVCNGWTDWIICVDQWSSAFFILLPIGNFAQERYPIIWKIRVLNFQNVFYSCVLYRVGGK